MTEYTQLATTRSRPGGGLRPAGPAGGDRGPSDPADDERALRGRRCRLETARTWLLSGGSVLFFGADRIGKSAALDTLVAAVGDARVLSCSPSADDAIRPYRGLGALLSTVTGPELDLLPSPRRRTLTALLEGRGERVGAGAAPGRLGRSRWYAATPASVGLATVHLLRLLARARPVVLVVDDVHRFDPASAEAMRFVGTRVGDVGVHMAAAERVTDGRPPIGRFLCPAPLLVVRLEPLATPSLAELVGKDEGPSRGVGRQS